MKQLLPFLKSLVANQRTPALKASALLVEPLSAVLPLKLVYIIQQVNITFLDKCKLKK